jgi:hypothetical protein
MYVLYRTFTDAIPVSGAYWHSAALFDIETDTITVSTLEWTQTSPPTFHTFEELPYLCSASNTERNSAWT